MHIVQQTPGVWSVLHNGQKANWMSAMLQRKNRCTSQRNVFCRKQKKSKASKKIAKTKRCNFRFAATIMLRHHLTFYDFFPKVRSCIPSTLLSSDALSQLRLSFQTLCASVVAIPERLEIEVSRDVRFTHVAMADHPNRCPPSALTHCRIHLKFDALLLLHGECFCEGP